jgi:peptidoglycan glycosyltransferase
VNTPIRRFGAAILVLYGLLFLQLNRITLLEADGYSSHPANTRAIVRDFSEPRGVIQTADGVVLAQSVETDDSSFDRLRQYPQGPLYSHITGFFSFTFGSDGVERTYNTELTGRDLDIVFQNLGDLLLERRPTGNVTLTIPSQLQQIAAQALGERKGSVIAIDPRDGAVLAMYSWPTYDPNVLSAHDQAAVQAAREALVADPNRPLLARTYRERYFPGSTFKMVTAAAGLERGDVTPTSPVYPTISALDLPNTDRDLHNYGDSACGGDLFRIIQISCNTAFAQMGLDVGAEAMAAEAGEFGFREAPPLDLPAVARSIFPEAAAFERDLPALAQSAIGQRDVQATPLQMALVAAAVANTGDIPVPHVMSEIRDDEGEVVRSWEPETWRSPLSDETADLLRQAMVGVVNGGTARSMQLPGVQVAAKTGTAELGADNESSHAWIVAFAPADAPRVAVVVIIEGAPNLGPQTGGRVAAPVAKPLLEAALALPDRLAQP